MLQCIQYVLNAFLILSILIHFEVFAKDERKANRIIGGRPCEPGEFPALVAIEKNGFHLCGGTIISKLHILTAAHCIDDLTGLNNPGIKILAGDVRIDQKIDSLRQTINVKTVKIHPEYDSVKDKNDIAVLTLENKLVLNKQVAIVTLSDKSASANTKCITAGWENPKAHGGATTPICLATGIVVHTKHKCQYPEPYFPKQIMGESQICAGYLTGKNDSCQGDSGGPLYCGTEQYGIVSYGHGCAIEGYGGVYTDVAYFQIWILEQVKRSSDLATDNEIVAPRRQTVGRANSRNCNKIAFSLGLMYSAFRHEILNIF